LHHLNSNDDRSGMSLRTRPCSLAGANARLAEPSNAAIPMHLRDALALASSG